MGNEISSCEENGQYEDRYASECSGIFPSSSGYPERIRVSFDMSALEEGRLPITVNYEYQKETPYTHPEATLVDISKMVTANSFVAFDRKDAESLVLSGEILDFVGDFPYLCDETEVESFEKLFHFVAENNFQLVTIDNSEFAILQIFVIRPKVLVPEN